MQVVKFRKRKALFKEFIQPFFPSNLEECIYVEPFGGSFVISTYLEKRPLKLVYNDITDYGIGIIADEILRLDYIDIINQYDSVKTFFYLDPPYFGKEDWYGNKKNDFDFHDNLFNALKKINGRFVLSYEDNKVIRNIWKGHEIIKYSGENQIFRNEILIVKN